MQVHEAFKLGFLSRCVEEGMNPEQTHGLSKMAASLFEKQALINLPSPMGEVRNAVGTLGDMACLKVMDGVANSWYQLVFIERWREEKDKHHYIYAEWLEYFLEDGNPCLMPSSPTS